MFKVSIPGIRETQHFSFHRHEIDKDTVNEPAANRAIRWLSVASRPQVVLNLVETMARGDIDHYINIERYARTGGGRIGQKQWNDCASNVGQVDYAYVAECTRNRQHIRWNITQNVAFPESRFL